VNAYPWGPRAGFKVPRICELVDCQTTMVGLVDDVAHHRRLIWVRPAGQWSA